MSELVTVITSKEDFDVRTQNGLVLVDFFAPWCGPCRMQLPILEAIAQKAQQAGPAVSICKVNTDEQPGIATSFGVESIPTLVLLKNGKEVQRFVGLQQENALLGAIRSFS